MGRARKTLAIVAFAAMVGCTVKSPASTPAILLSTHRHTLNGGHLHVYAHFEPSALPWEFGASAFEVETMPYSQLLEKLEAGGVDYFISSQHSPDATIYGPRRSGLTGWLVVINAANDLSDLVGT